ncbi:acyltransferase family protein [Streptomyces sioyaensis]|uniref:acyltransferase family protein n=1 Tax=Streptomyces sioyaensis TaxID=67364 RepID=UPI0036A4D54B
MKSDDQLRLPEGATRGPRTEPAPRAYAAGLDGLRALAVTAVVVYHVNPAWLPGGFLGVDVFFGLSGYLITHLLITEWQRHGRIDLRGFWLRRARRLLPALAVVLLTATAAAAVLRPNRLESISGSLLSAATFTNNWWQISTHASYFASFGPPPLFEHLWTLSVEEQFYLLWPLTLLALLRLMRGRAARTALVLALVAASATAMALLHEPGVDPSRVYFGTDTHAFPLLIGAALALLRPTARLLPRRYRLQQCCGRLLTLRPVDGIGAAGLIVLAVMAGSVSQNDGLMYPGGFVLVALATGAAVIGSVQPLGALATLLGTSVPRWIGKRSYGIYLWHFPLISLATPDRRTPADAPLNAIAAAVASVALAALSYRWVEQPIRRSGVVAALRRLRDACFSTRAGRTRTAWVTGAVVLASATVTTLAATSAPAPRGSRGPLAHAPAGRRSPSLPPLSGRTVPAGKVSAIGDSVMVAATSALKETFPDITIDADVGRQLSAASREVNALKKKGTLGDTVIIALGTNGTGGEAALQAAIDAIGPGKRIVLVTCHVGQPWQKSVNNAIGSVAKRHDNVAVADWNKAISGHDDLLAADGVHPGPGGAKIYADTIAAALATLPATPRRARAAGTRDGGAPIPAFGAPGRARG